MYNNITRYCLIKNLRYTKHVHLFIHMSVYVLIFLVPFLTLDYFLIFIFLIPFLIFPSIVTASFFCLSYNIVKLLLLVSLLSLVRLITVNKNTEGAIRTRYVQHAWISIREKIPKWQTRKTKAPGMYSKNFRTYVTKLNIFSLPLLLKKPHKLCMAFSSQNPSNNVSLKLPGNRRA